VARDLTGGVWEARDTTPAEVEAALRQMLMAHAAKDHGTVPARVLNLVAIVDRQWRGEIENRLERVGRYHASRTILCSVEPGRRTIDARAILATDPEPVAGEFDTTHEHVILDIGTQHLPHLDTIVDPLVVTDLPTMVWAPHGHTEAIDVLLRLAQVALFDSVDDPDVEDGIERACRLVRRVYVVDLAWLRSTPWRERVASAFDPPKLRPQLERITELVVRHHPASGAAAVLFAGWMASRLGWTTSTLAERGGTLQGKAGTRKGDVKLRFEPAPEQSVRGLAGLTITTASGMELTLDRGEGGLRARRAWPRRPPVQYVVMGASRGEYGILGEGIRQALLRDPTYRPALEAALPMLV